MVCNARWYMAAWRARRSGWGFVGMALVSLACCGDSRMSRRSSPRIAVQRVSEPHKTGRLRTPPRARWAAPSGLERRKAEERRERRAARVVGLPGREVDRERARRDLADRVGGE